MTDLTSRFQMLNRRLTILSSYVTSEVQGIKADLKTIKAQVEKGGCEAQASAVIPTSEKIGALKDEVLEALARLEQMDI